MKSVLEKSGVKWHRCKETALLFAPSDYCVCLLMAEGQKVRCRGQSDRPTWCLLPQDLRFPTDRQMNIYLMDAEHRLHANTHRKFKSVGDGGAKDIAIILVKCTFFWQQPGVLFSWLCYVYYWFFFLPFMKAAVFIIKTSVWYSSSTRHVASADGALMLTLFWSCSGFDWLPGYSVHTGLRDTYNYWTSELVTRGFIPQLH